MASTLVLAVVKYGLLILLWLFVVSAVQVVRSDLFGTATRGGGVARAGRAGRDKVSGQAGRLRSQARRLVVTEGALAGTSIDLGESPVTIGRDDSSTLVITDDYASGQHARLVPSDGAWVLEDLGSTNGTYLGQAKVGRPVAVPVGAQIRIGKTVLELRR